MKTRKAAWITAREIRRSLRQAYVRGTASNIRAAKVPKNSGVGVVNGPLCDARALEGDIWRVGNELHVALKKAR